MKLETCYKVTTLDCQSVCKNFKNCLQELVLTYSTEHFTVPRLDGSGLFVFKDIQKAQDFINRVKRKQDKLGNTNLHFLIWEAVGMNVRPKSRAVNINRNLTISRIISFWRGISSRRWIGRFTGKGYDYFVADAVKLVKVVSV